MFERRFLTKQLKCCFGTKSYGKSITTLSKGATREFIYFVASKVRKRWERLTLMLLSDLSH